jgi:hypothetical protein
MAYLLLTVVIRCFERSQTRGDQREVEEVGVAGEACVRLAQVACVLARVKEASRVVPSSPVNRRRRTFADSEAEVDAEEPGDAGHVDVARR